MALSACKNHESSSAQTGPTSVGKSFIASSIGHHACHPDYKVMYFNLQKLVQKLRVAIAEGTYINEINRIEKGSANIG